MQYSKCALGGLGSTKVATKYIKGAFYKIQLANGDLNDNFVYEYNKKSKIPGNRYTPDVYRFNFNIFRKNQGNGQYEYVGYKYIEDIDFTVKMVRVKKPKKIRY